MLAESLRAVGPMREDETLHDYLARALDGDTVEGMGDAEARAEAYTPADKLLHKNHDSLAELGQWGRYYPPRPWDEYCEQVQQDATRQMRLIGCWRRKRGDTAWHWDESQPWTQPVLPMKLLIQLFRQRWNASTQTRRMVAIALRFHYDHHGKPRAYQMLEALVARHPSRLCDAAYYAERNARQQVGR